MQDHRTRPSPSRTPPAAIDQRPPRTRVKSEFHRALGHVVRYTRARRGLSQEALGDEAELHRNYVGAIERGEINPTFRVLLKLARGLGLPLSELIREQERIVSPPRE
ncbi:MAG: helix-turn-helix transcriptional regulator [Conexibacter sp.]